MLAEKSNRTGGKFLGDLYLQLNNYESAGNAYINFLTKLNNNVEYVKHFAQFMERYSEVVHDMSRYLLHVQDVLDSQIQNQDVIVSICEIVSHYMEYPEIKFFINDKTFSQAVSYIHKIENSCQLYILFYKVLSINHTKNNKRIDKYVVSLMEKKVRYKEALLLIVEVLRYDQDRVAVRTMFRICRKLDDYSEAEKYVETHPDIKEQGEFNILYELVFYYSKIGNIENRNKVLKKIENCGRNSVPIMRTLYNFYLQFGMLDKAVEIKSIIAQVQTSKKRNSMSELLKGFTHELGQPITNIHYGVQLFQMKIEKGINTNEELKILVLVKNSVGNFLNQQQLTITNIFYAVPIAFLSNCTQR